VMKAAMEMLGYPAGPVRPPLTECRAQDVEDLRKLMEVYRESLDTVGRTVLPSATMPQGF